jgi:hypothetical protein
VPSSNEDGDDPPHALAKAQYESVAPSGFLCTGDDEESDDPIVFEVDEGGVSLFSGGQPSGESKAAEAVMAARGGAAPHATQVGFG